MYISMYINKEVYLNGTDTVGRNLNHIIKIAITIHTHSYTH